MAGISKRLTVRIGHDGMVLVLVHELLLFDERSQSVHFAEKSVGIQITGHCTVGAVNSANGRTVMPDASVPSNLASPSGRRRGLSGEREGGARGGERVEGR